MLGYSNIFNWAQYIRHNIVYGHGKCSRKISTWSPISAHSVQGSLYIWNKHKAKIGSHSLQFTSLISINAALARTNSYIGRFFPRLQLSSHLFGTLTTFNLRHLQNVIYYGVKHKLQLTKQKLFFMRFSIFLLVKYDSNLIRRWSGLLLEWRGDVPHKHNLLLFGTTNN